MTCPFCGVAMKEVERKRYSIIWECLKCEMEVTATGLDNEGKKVALKKEVG